MVQMSALKLLASITWRMSFTTWRFLMGLGTDSTEVINEVIYGVRKGGRIGLIGAYAGFAKQPLQPWCFMEKGLSMPAGQTPVQKYWPTLFPLVQSGELDPTIVITHVLGLGDAPDAYALSMRKNRNGSRFC